MNTRRSLVVVTAGMAMFGRPAGPQELFSDDFERGLVGWNLLGDGVKVADSGDPGHGQVMILEPHGDVLATIIGSETWDGVQLEFDVRFPTAGQSYLGVAYNVQERAGRHDFGLIYIKGNNSYLQVNPHRDFNVGRTLYGEYHVDLTGAAAIRVGGWQHVRVEQIGSECHFYVGDLSKPQLMFSMLELDAGRLGLQPRSVGDDVWVDNVRVRPLGAFSYRGPTLPRLSYDPDSLLTAWKVAGPFVRTRDELARAPASFSGAWSDFQTDARGAVISAKVVDYHGPLTVAYFRTQVQAPVAAPAILHLSAVDDLALWVNGRFHWFIPRGELAWYDYWRNESHAGTRIPVMLHKGTNEIVLRVRGGVYASGGFFARMEPESTGEHSGTD